MLYFIREKKENSRLWIWTTFCSILGFVFVCVLVLYTYKERHIKDRLGTDLEVWSVLTFSMGYVQCWEGYF